MFLIAINFTNQLKNNSDVIKFLREKTEESNVFGLGSVTPLILMSERYYTLYYKKLLKLIIISIFIKKFKILCEPQLAMSPLKKNFLYPPLSILFFIALAGCTSIPEDAQFNKVAKQIEDRSGLHASWQVNTPQDAAIETRINNLLSAPLTTTSAVQISLLNNPGLQAKYAQFGIAQANLSQAGLFINPNFSSFIGFSKDGKITDLDFNLIFNFLNILTTPLRKSIAESEFEEAQLKMLKVTLDLAGQTRKAYYQALATQQIKGLFKQIVKSTQSAYLAAKDLRTAGNIPALQMAQEQSSYEHAKVDLMEIESNHNQAVEHLKQLMGLGNYQTDLQLEIKLPDPTDDSNLTEESIDTILNKNIDLALIKQHLETLTRQYHMTNSTALIPELKLGASTKYQCKDWDYGPSLEFILPIFDQGQPALAKAKFEIQEAQKAYANTSVQVLSLTRSLKNKVIKFKQRALHLKNTLLPLNQKIINETQHHYNAMQVGVFDLLQSKQMQIDGERKYAQALLDYWSARSDLELLLQGSIPIEEPIRWTISEGSSSKKDLE